MRLVVAQRGQGKTRYLVDCLCKDASMILLVQRERQQKDIYRVNPTLNGRVFTHREALTSDSRMMGYRSADGSVPTVLIDDLEEFLHSAMVVPTKIGDVTTTCPCVNLNPYAPSVSEDFRG